MHLKPQHPGSEEDETPEAFPPGIASRRETAPNLPPFGGLPHSEIPSTRYPSHTPLAMTNSSERNDEARRALPFPGPVPPEATLAAPLISPPSPPAPFPSSNTSTTSANETSILTPTSGTAMTDGASPSPGINGSSSQQSPVGGSSMYYPGHAHGSWPTPPTLGYNYSNTSPASGGFPRSNFNNIPSPQLSPYPGRTSASPADGGVLPGTSAYQDHSAFPSPAGGGGSGSGTGSGGAGSNGGGSGGNTGVNGGAGSFGPTLNSQSHGTTSSSGLAMPILGGQGQTGPQPSSDQSPVGGPAASSEGHVYRPPSTSGYYPPVSSPQQGAFPHASQPGPSPTATAGPHSGRPLIPLVPSTMFPGAARSYQMPPATYGQFSSIPGAVLSNMHQPGHPMSMVSYQHPYQMHSHLYLAQQPQPHPPSQERPFKCDTCPQSFNRNHDLKRHSRIHLAVKPFPCINCDKSFSRKDALKRHRMVKGCEFKVKEASGDTNSNSGDTNSNAQGESPNISDNDTASPMVFKTEQ
ncbi:hypothetical protein B0T21DRAFT_453487 [Apiosordaria backusii]|uniref:C2H2-type domain-containing protein n=1 Tax=Apiosordaria backusii TaxID=314023 RepID=A0AA40AXQ7_9PEZI|nr:hypothetical protein B0T21DRAFT_453487 [Apiosordaria backusii]